MIRIRLSQNRPRSVDSRAYDRDNDQTRGIPPGEAHVVDRGSSPTDFDAAQLGGGGKLARKPERAHDERRVDAFVRQPRMTHDVERMREDAPHADAAHDGARFEREDGGENGGIM